jgi:peptidoglycan/LPS O-acetylase OafA/YrhL
MRYLPQIDGLRGIAVVGVLLFHLGLSQISGGYVGVDVFFVVSGYLITRLIRAEVRAATFTFKKFYVRRARRLFPALFFTLATSLVAACLLLSPGHLENFATTLAAAILSVSNILFWQESGYFDLTATVKPLLHTWSLGIEEQFYLLWPWLLVLLLRRFPPLVLPTIAIGAVVSFGLNLAFASKTHATIFYLLPFRAFEFAIGALMVWIEQQKPKSAVVLETLAVAGVALIFWPMLAYTPETAFPTYNALAPCVGTALLIFSGDARYTGLLLRNRIAVGIGLISYSLYLIHWPLIVFYRYLTLAPLDATEQIGLAATSFAAAVAMYRFIERPFCRPGVSLRSQVRFVSSAAGLSVALVIVSGLVAWSGGWPWRIPSERFLPSGAEFQKQEDVRCGGRENSGELVTCLVDRGSERDIYVLGDSHSRTLVTGLAKFFPQHNIKVMFYTGCFPHRGLDGYTYDLGSEELNTGCAKRNRDAQRFFETATPTNVVISFWTIEADFSPEYIAALKDLVNDIVSHGHNVKFVGDSIRPGIYAADCFAVPAAIPDSLQQKRCIGDQQLGQRLEAQNDRLATILGPSIYINNNGLFCMPVCINNIDGKPLFRDTNHLTPFGSEYLVAHIAPLLQIH